MSKLRIAKWYRGELFLTHDQVSENTGRIMYTIPLVQVFEHEKDMNRGRFLRYTHDPQEYEIAMEMTQFAEPTPWVNWIAEHGEDLWNLRVSMQNVNFGVCNFSFASAKTAMIFKMVFQ